MVSKAASSDGFFRDLRAKLAAEQMSLRRVKFALASASERPSTKGLFALQ
jgi:hypothetical protein